MTQFSSPSPNPSPQGALNTMWTAALIRWAGYGLLLLSLFDLVEVFIPPNFTDPTWELQTIGTIIERIPVPLLSVILIFYGETNFRQHWELGFLKVLSWASLVFGVILLLFLPLGAINTVRINQQTGTQLNLQYNQQQERATQIQEQLTQATPQDIQAFLESQGAAEADQNPAEIKDQLLVQITQARQELQTQYETTRSNQRVNLLKRSAKWNLGALVSGFLFIYIWRLTRWTRFSTFQGARRKSSRSAPRGT